MQNEKKLPEPKFFKTEKIEFTESSRRKGGYFDYSTITLNDAFYYQDILKDGTVGAGIFSLASNGSGTIFYKRTNSFKIDMAIEITRRQFNNAKKKIDARIAAELAAKEAKEAKEKEHQRIYNLGLEADKKNKRDELLAQLAAIPQNDLSAAKIAWINAGCVHPAPAIILADKLSQNKTWKQYLIKIN